MRHASSLAGLALIAIVGTGAAQGTAPLHKADLVRLLSSPLIPSREVADVVRRNCLAFRPTDRDLTDIRGMGATAEVLASITGCADGRIAARPAAADPAPATSSLQVFVRRPRMVAAAGSVVHIPVIAARGGMPQGGAQLALRGSRVVEGTGADAVAVTDDSGFAVFQVKAGRRVSTYRWEVAPAGGGSLPGRPMVEVAVRAGAPALVAVEPRQLVFEGALDTLVTVAAVIRDSVRIPVSGEPVALRAAREETGFETMQGTTDSLGGVTFTVRRGALRRSGVLQLVARGEPLAAIDVEVGARLSEAETGFLALRVDRGAPGASLPEPLVFEARTRFGLPAGGRAVAFRAENAVVTPAAAMTDSAGRVRVDVRLGTRVGPAVLVAVIDSIEKHVTLGVDPGPPSDLAIEYNGKRVDGRWVVVRRDTTITLRVRAWDVYGNPARTGGVGRFLRENRAALNARQSLIEFVAVDEAETVVTLTIRTREAGRAKLAVTRDHSAWLEIVDTP